MGESGVMEMNCKKCGGELQQGYAQVHSTLISFLTFWGLSWHNLYFVADSSPGKVRRVAFFRQVRTAFRCPRCNIVAVTPLKWREKPGLTDGFKPHGR
jgi:hypothetical protein